MRLIVLATISVLVGVAMSGCGGASSSGPGPTPTPTPTATPVPELAEAVTTPIPQPAYATNGPVLGPDGNFWLVVNLSSSLAVARLTPAGVYNAYTIPGSASKKTFGLVVGPDGALWFVMGSSTTAQLVRSDLSGNVTEYSLPAGTGQTSSVAVGSDGNLWFVAQNVDTQSDNELLGFSPTLQAVVGALILPASTGTGQAGGSIAANSVNGELVVSTSDPAGFLYISPGSIPAIQGTYSSPNVSGGISALTSYGGQLLGIFTPDNRSANQQQIVSLNETSGSVSYVNLPQTISCSSECVSGLTNFRTPLVTDKSGTLYAWSSGRNADGDPHTAAQGFAALSLSGNILGIGSLPVGADPTAIFPTGLLTASDGTLWGSLSIVGQTSILHISPVSEGSASVYRR